MPNSFVSITAVTMMNSVFLDLTLRNLVKFILNPPAQWKLHILWNINNCLQNTMSHTTRQFPSCLNEGIPLTQRWIPERRSWLRTHAFNHISHQQLQVFYRNGIIEWTKAPQKVCNIVCVRHSLHNLASIQYRFSYIHQHMTCHETGYICKTTSNFSWSNLTHVSRCLSGNSSMLRVGLCLKDTRLISCQSYCLFWDKTGFLQSLSVSSVRIPQTGHNHIPLKSFRPF